MEPGRSRSGERASPSLLLVAVRSIQQFICGEAAFTKGTPRVREGLPEAFLKGTASCYALNATTLPPQYPACLVEL